MPTEFFLIDDRNATAVLTRGPDGTPSPTIPEPFLLKAHHISGPIGLESSLDTARQMLERFPPLRLFWFFPSPDGPPYRTGRLFQHQGSQRLNYLETSGRLHPAATLHRYVVSSEGGLEVGSYFATGTGGRTALWKIFRIERDVLDSLIFTLAPLEVASGFPHLDLSSVPESNRQEILAQYEELKRCTLGQAYRGAITCAKNIAEAIIPIKANLPPGRTFFDTLQAVRIAMEHARTQGREYPISDLSYHLAQKLRVLHGRTHPEGSINAGRQVFPEFALSAVQDILEILRDFGYTSE